MGTSHFSSLSIPGRLEGMGCGLCAPNDPISGKRWTYVILLEWLNSLAELNVQEAGLLLWDSWDTAHRDEQKWGTGAQQQKNRSCLPFLT